MRNLSLFLTLILLFALTIVTRVLPEGYHPDSLVYMSMARNLAEGDGGFWELHFTDTLLNPFYEHPPLGIYLMSVPFRLFGGTFIIDRLYGPIFGILTLLLIAYVTRLAAPGTRHGSYLAPLYFLLFPIAGYTLENNLLEISASFFALASVAIFLFGMQKKMPLRLVALLFVLLQTTAFFNKGPVVLFPMALPLFYAFLFPQALSLRRMLCFYLLTLGMVGIVGAFFYLYPPSHHYLGSYFEHQILASVNGMRGGGEHFKLLSQLALDSGGLFLLSFLAILAAGARRELRFSRTVWLFVLIGLSASLPLEVSPRQHSYYIFPALPYFAIALGLLFETPLRTALKKAGGYKLVHAVNLLLLVAFVAVSWQKIGTCKRHAHFFHDFVDANITLEDRAQIRGCADGSDHYMFFHNTELTGNLQRRYGADLIDTNATLPYFLTTVASDTVCPPPQGCRYIGPAAPERYRLYRCDDAIMAP